MSARASWFTPTRRCGAKASCSDFTSLNDSCDEPTLKYPQSIRGFTIVKLLIVIVVIAER